MMTALLTSAVKESARRSVLCWLATADENGQPNVSPQEIFSVIDKDHIVVANIASPGTANNIRVNATVCLSFIDVFVQKGFKVIGIATDVKPSSPKFSKWVAPLRAMVIGRFPIRSVFVIRAIEVERIFSPSYRFHPNATTEESQIQSALSTYRVTRRLS
jgi:predicted pyridoxine 5'-phosphate oxidase superfamily flavin-nucleotide-binding protein